MMREYSSQARERVTEPWEECVLYVYDDKRPKEIVNGKRRYVEWDGGPVKGTLTIGFGHTDAAGGLKITPGLRLTRSEADDLLSADLEPCVRAVNRLLQVEVTQHQFDMVIDTYFNCPSGAIAAIKLFNAGQADKVPAKLLQYVCSKGERMQGLVNRRNAEIAWGNTPDEVEPPPAPNPDVVFSPKAERDPPPKSIVKSKTAVAGGTVLSFSIAEAAKAFNEMLEPIKQAKGSLADLGLFDHASLAVANPQILLCALVAGLAIFIIFDRRSKLVNDHV